MVTFLAAPGLMVTLPLEELRVVSNLAQLSDSIVFWHRGTHQDGSSGAWQPILMPRSAIR